MLPDVSEKCRFFETSENANPMVQRHTTQKGFYQHRFHENPKSYTTEP
jgi:hypothetical protein